MKFLKMRVPIGFLPDGTQVRINKDFGDDIEALLGIGSTSTTTGTSTVTVAKADFDALVARVTALEGGYQE